MRALTTKELVDILFQRPDRITKNILQERSLFQKLKDEALTWDAGGTRNGSPGSLEKLKHKAFLHFEAASKVSPEHPRSLKKAAFELKALGFSNKQVEDIKDCAYRFTLIYCEPGLPLSDILDKDYPDYSYEWCDDAFLGAALVPGYKNKEYATAKEFCAAVDQNKKDQRNTALTKNTIFTPAREEEAYALFQKHLSQNVDGSRSSLPLMPAHPRKAYEKLCP